MSISGIAFVIMIKVYCLKENLNELFVSCLAYLLASTTKSDTDSNSESTSKRRENALKTLIIFVRSMGKKGFGGWEIMEVYAGGVQESDAVFTVSTFGSSGTNCTF